MDQNQDNKDIIFGLVAASLSLLLIGGVPYLSYRYGRFVERRLLTEIFVQTIGQDYYTGYGDAEKDCRNGDIR